MALVVADAGPLIALAQIGQLAILHQLFGEITVPAAVWSESQAKPTEDSVIIRQAKEDGWIKVVTVEVDARFSHALHAGEVEALQLAGEWDDVLLIVDDQLARREAARLGLNFIGTVKVLSLAQQKGFITSAKDCVEAMQAVGYRVSVKFLDGLI